MRESRLLLQSPEWESREDFRCCFSRVLQPVWQWACWNCTNGHASYPSHPSPRALDIRFSASSLLDALWVIPVVPSILCHLLVMATAVWMLAYLLLSRVKEAFSALTA